MSDTTRESIFLDAAKRMRAEFEDARNNVPHRGEKGGEGETIVRKFLNEHLPKRFHATNGFVIDDKDGVSGHLDVIIYDQMNCPVYRTSERGMIVPNHNVARVFEVKFDLTGHLDEAIDKIHSIRSLRKKPLNENLPGWTMTQTYGVVFAFESKLNPDTVLESWHRKLGKDNPLHRSCGMIVVLDQGIFVTVTNLPGAGAGPVYLENLPTNAPMGTQVGMAFLEYKDRTLDGMLRLLLPYLSMFRGQVDLPKFNFAELGPLKMRVAGEKNKSGWVYFETPKSKP